MVQALRLDGPIAPYLSLLLVTFLGLFVWLSCQVALRAEPHKASFFLLMKKLSALLKSALKTNWLALAGAVGVVMGLASLAVLLVLVARWLARPRARLLHDDFHCRVYVLLGIRCGLS